MDGFLWCGLGISAAVSGVLPPALMLPSTTHFGGAYAHG